MGRIPSGAKIWMLCLLSWELAVKTSQHIETGSDDILFGHGRDKRSMPSVLGKLLAGAKLMMNNGDYKLFSRPGGYAQARADFEALGLTNVKKTKSVTGGRVGNVGDRTVMLTHDVSGGGSIDIWLYKVHPDGRALPVSIDRIRYMN